MQKRWLISLFSLTSLTSLFAGFTLLFFRFKVVAYIFFFIEFFFLCLFCLVTLELISQDDKFVQYKSLEVERQSNDFVAQLGVMMGVRSLIFIVQLVIIVFRLKKIDYNNGEDNETEPNNSEHDLDRNEGIGFAINNENNQDSDNRV